MMALEDPFAGSMSEGAGSFIGLELVQRRVVGKIEEDDVVEIPAVRDVVPADESDPEALFVVLQLAREGVFMKNLKNGSRPRRTEK